MTCDKFHFFSLGTTTRYHIARRLTALGWERANDAHEACFTDRHLSIDDTIGETLEYKNRLAQLMKRHQLPWMPLTYCLDEDSKTDVFAEIIYNHYLKKQQYKPDTQDIKWILKPATLNNGDWIRLFDHIDAVKAYYSSNDRLGGPHILQQYIDNPALLNQRKYTYRLHVFVTNYGGVFVYHQGYVNVSGVPYEPQKGFDNKKMHITNYMIDGDLAHISQQTTHELPGFEKLHAQMKQQITSVFQALIKEVPDYLNPKEPPRFEIFGCDFILDDAGRLWLLEINQGADAPMYEDNPLKPILWDPYWQDVLETFVLPIAQNRVGPIKNPNFHAILTPGQCYSSWRCALKRLIG